MDGGITSVIDHDQVLFADRYFLEGLGDADKAAVLKKWLGDFLHCRLDIPEEGDVDFLFFRSLVRPDYRLLLHDIAETVGDRPTLIVEDYLKRSPRINPDASAMLREKESHYYSFAAPTPLDRACMYIRLCYYYLVLARLSRIRCKAIVTFADMQPVENLVVQRARRRGIPTVTLQHGLYVDYGDYRTVNVINYLHQPSEHFLSWGDDTRETIQRHHPSAKIVICGKPRVTIPNEVEPRGGNDRRPYMTVVMDQRIFDEQNFEMFRVASEVAARRGWNLNVKFHPSNNRKQYDALGINYIEGRRFANSTCVIGHTSSLIYEAMHFGVPVLRYRSPVPALVLPEALEFTSPAELDEKLDATHDYGALARRYIACTGDESLTRYRAFFDRLLAT